MRSTIRSLLAAALLLAACGGDTAETTVTTSPSETTTTAVTTTAVAEITTSQAPTTTTQAVDPYTFDITIEGSTVTGGGRLVVPVGETVTLRITADVADEVHIHGYDLFVELEPDVPAEISFPADIPGVVEVETHHSQLVIANLEAS